MSEWRLIDNDFARTFRVELDDNLHRPFRWFHTRIAGLLSYSDTLLHARFAAVNEPAREGDML